MAEIPISLYIHMPWCKRKCPYCDFNSYAIDQVPEDKYVDLLIKDLTNDLTFSHSRDNGDPGNHDQLLDSRLRGNDDKSAIHSIYIGGGTPTLLSANNISKLLPKKSNCEITIEANPGTIDIAKLKALKNIGINRLSIGVQSLQDDKLQALGRIHNSRDAVFAIEMAHETGFTNINVDLMYGLPEQKISDALYDLEQVLKLQPTHLSWYQLTIEEGTPFYQHRPNLPDDDLLWQMQQQGQQLIADYGLQQYEVSAYSKPGYACQHNLNYWQFGDYLGIGAGAHGKITDKNIFRVSKHADPDVYIQAENFIADQEQLTKQQIIADFMLNALRLYQPITLDLFTERTGLPISSIEQQLNQAQTQGFLSWNDKYIETTDLGKRFLNDMLLRVSL